MLRRIGVVGDVHTEDRLLCRALEMLRAQSPDAILCPGDIVTGPGDAAACARLLQEYGVHVVRGNHDRWFTGRSGLMLPHATLPQDVPAEMRRWIGGLPRTLTFETVTGPLLLCHGLGENDMACLNPYDQGYALQSNLDLWKLLAEDPPALVVFGHTHRRMVRRIEGTLFINAGTLRRDHEPCCLFLDLESGVASFHGFGESDVTPIEAVPLPGG